MCARGEARQAEFWKNARQAHEQGSATIYVLPGGVDVPILGFYAICMSKVQLTDLPEPYRARRSLPPQCPAALIAQLARDARSPKGTGKRLLGDAVARIVEISASIACVAITLDAQEAGLVSYYEEHGFTAIGTRRNVVQKMFMPIAEARAAYEVADEL